MASRPRTRPGCSRPPAFTAGIAVRVSAACSQATSRAAARADRRRSWRGAGPPGKFASPVHTRILGGILLAALLTAPVLYVGPDQLPALLDWLLCASAAAILIVLALRGTGEATRSLPEGMSWTVQEESDPSIA
ncbi:hypothetical protein ACFRCI_18255 [Streptomyces sp. NPDC056638]|uniref:hypothetical protein n=1 Tax=Streptomyces sp. NPDC056638 TaxID=3345887 RepID=UPI003686D93A